MTMTKEERKKETTRLWKLANAERVREHRRKSYEKNREREVARSQQWNVDNPATLKAGKAANQRHRDYVKKLPLMSRAERVEAEAMYEFCRLFPAYSVDHIIPFKGRNVSGLHVLSNLQIILLDDNRKKHATFNPEEHEHAPVAIMVA